MYCNHRCNGASERDCKKIKEKEEKENYILQVKKNQPELMEDLSEYFQKEVLGRDKKELEKEDRYYRSECFEHGRIFVKRKAECEWEMLPRI